MNSYPLILLVGHRGVGKSSLLQRIARYREEAALPGNYLDLDCEIARRTGQSVEQIFAEQGEARFRQIEEQVLNETVQEHEPFTYVALGAGYERAVPANAFVLWVRRPTDAEGRIFFNRPRLNAQVSPLEEFLQRKPVRDRRYHEMAHLQWMLREGVQSYDIAEKEFFTGHFSKSVGGVLTLQEKWLQPQTVDALTQIPGLTIEVRDDLLTENQWSQWRNAFAQNEKIFSFRNAPSWLALEKEIAARDWALELGAPSLSPTILSLHERNVGETIFEFLRRLDEAGRGQDVILKAAPIIENFLELKALYDWQQEAPAKRAILPRSPGDGDRSRWSWFRLLMKNRMPLNFWRLDDGSAPDQPTFADWLNQPFTVRHFAAVLGSPVRHSRTPVTQQEFFARTKWPVYAIDVGPDEWNDAWPVLTSLGLRAAAVTAPLKEKAFAVANVLTAEAEKFKAVNTLWVDIRGRVHGHNTDHVGLQRALAELSLTGRTAVWGGGGTVEVMRNLLPQAYFFSARSGELRDGAVAKPDDFENLLWACGDREGIRKPPLEWKIQKVIDLSYVENSPGREMALMYREKYCTCEYISGQAMFDHQARAQREYWQSFLVEDV